ncbi:hypothetical protein, partial [Escherichia coli]|uniref:hypothetical protein n=1 Tax=Escherichia coli TaxID=562 RepID=UPI001BC84988
TRPNQLIHSGAPAVRAMPEIKNPLQRCIIIFPVVISLRDYYLADFKKDIQVALVRCFFRICPFVVRKENGLAQRHLP